MYRDSEGRETWMNGEMTEKLVGASSMDVRTIANSYDGELTMDQVIRLDADEFDRVRKILQGGPQWISATTWPVNVRDALQDRDEDWVREEPLEF